MSRIMFLLVGIIGSISGIALAVTLEISWNPNTESNLAGYNISWDGPSSDRWSTPTGAYEHSSIGVSTANTTYDIEDAAAGNYAVYVRAYNTAGLMSDYEPFAFTLTTMDTIDTTGIAEPTKTVPLITIIVDPITTVKNYEIYQDDIFKASIQVLDTTGTSIDKWYMDNTLVSTDTTLSTTPNKIGIIAIRGRGKNNTWHNDATQIITVKQIPAMRGGSF